MKPSGRSPEVKKLGPWCISNQIVQMPANARQSWRLPLRDNACVVVNLERIPMQGARCEVSFLLHLSAALERPSASHSLLPCPVLELPSAANAIPRLPASYCVHCHARFPRSRLPMPDAASVAHHVFYRTVVIIRLHRSRRILIFFKTCFAPLLHERGPARPANFPIFLCLAYAPRYIPDGKLELPATSLICLRSPF
jgi:hypothetical protein